MHYVLGFAFYGQEVVLIRKERPNWQKGLVNGVGGKVEPDDLSVSHTMSREFYEETGVRIHRSRWSRKLTLNSLNDKWLMDVFWTVLNEDEFKNIKTMTDEVVIRANYRSLPPNCIPNLYWMIPMCLDQSVGYIPILIKDK